MYKRQTYATLNTFAVEGDVRFDTFFEVNEGVKVEGSTYSLYQFVKFPGNSSLRTGSANNLVNMCKPFRLSEMYLIAAEADARLNGGSTTATGTGYINALRNRAHATTQTQYSLNQILDERARELYYEGFRRTDLIRYGLFNSNEYLWDWKGGSEKGVGFSKDRCLYPLPADDVNANPNLKGHQNPGYGN